MFDQQVAPARLVAEQRAHLFERAGVELSPAALAAALLAPPFRAGDGHGPSGLPERHAADDVDRLQTALHERRHAVLCAPAIRAWRPKRPAGRSSARWLRPRRPDR